MTRVVLDTAACEALVQTQAQAYQGQTFGPEQLPVTASVAAFEQPQPRFASPWWVYRAAEPQRFNGVCWVAPQLALFDAHFPGNPLLPGVVQIDWAIEAARAEFAELKDLAFDRMSRIKFKGPVKPGAWLSLTLQLREGAADCAELSFEFACSGSVVTQGRFRFAR